LHGVPFGTSVGVEHAPVEGLHAPATWHWSLAEQVTGFDPVHTPDTHALRCMHGLLPVHAVPSVAAGFEHTPVDGLHVPATWHWSVAVQVTGLVPVHTPETHASVGVQAFPSSHQVPSGAVGLEHRPVVGSHTPTT
jgi:hypothetical protein